MFSFRELRHKKKPSRISAMPLADPTPGVCDAAVPPSLVKHTEQKLREAYFHAAKARVRELELHPGRPVHDADGWAANPGDPKVGIEKTIQDLKQAATKEVEVSLEKESEIGGAAFSVDQALDAREKLSNTLSIGSDSIGSAHLVSPSAPPPAKRARTDDKKKTQKSKNVASVFAALATATTRRVRCDWQSAYGLLVTKTLTMHQVVADSQHQQQRHKWRTETITARHKDLRSRVAKKEKGKERESTDGDEKVDDYQTWHFAANLPVCDRKDRTQLHDYAEAAEETGRKAWVTEALRWCHDVIINFTKNGGAVEFAVKHERRAFFKRNARRMTERELQALRQSLAAGYLGARGDPGLVPMRADDVSLGDGLTRCFSAEEKEATEAETNEKEPSNSRPLPVVLDVGSCWDYFRVFETRGCYNVTALDLCPRSVDVFRCDFLELRVSAPGTEVGAEDDEKGPGLDGDESKSANHDPQPNRPNRPNQKFLISLPANSVSAVVLSLVLSYVPSPELRGEMIRKAREVLLDNGRGVLTITTPHSTDRAYSNKNKTNVLDMYVLGLSQILTHCLPIVYSRVIT